MNGRPVPGGVDRGRALMRASLLVEFADAGRPTRRVGTGERAALAALCAPLPGLLEARLYEPAQAFDPMLDDGPPPMLCLQASFDSVDALSQACARNGPLQKLADDRLLPGLAGAVRTHQAMLTRLMPVPPPQSQPLPAIGSASPCGLVVPPEPASGCAYLVAYDGPADNLDEWLSFYLTHHPPLMARFPGIRAIEIGTRLDHHGFLPGLRASCMLRNKVVFDDPAALDLALASPVRAEMRADFGQFPPYAGGVRHHAMSMARVGPAAG